MSAPELPRPSPLRHGWTPAAPLRRPVLFINPASGGGKAVHADLAGRARALGIDVFTFGPDASLDELVADAVRGGADGLGVAGGDGSLAVAAAAAVTHGLALVCIPAGTRNHFALDLGVDRRDLVGALEAFTEGVERRIDVGKVDGRLFLNNVSLGIYGEAIQRSGYRDAKVRTLAETVRAVLGPSRAAPALHIVDDRGREHAHPAAVLVSNNPYALNRPLVTGTRPTLASGQLGIVVLDLPDGPRPQAGRAWTASSVVIDAKEPVHAGLDGEAVILRPPLELLIRPTVLRVRISSRHPGVSPSGLLKP
ncbi:diacylglycerol kinase family protein [Georgenia sp. SYP-B2076]|uniref:diacylglycerol/lipid kinase family protein n=1 Tax=Georgenia sp. SYP-B2076 TaxID=2495881 RepID=UPI000F8E7302|nr:diacylglycerol kinase family protein [Georgenia sp. SYP-B2076]